MFRSLRILMNTEIAQMTGIRSKATMAKPASSAVSASQQVFDREDKYGAHNYHPIPVALCRGKGDNHFYLLPLRTS